MDVTEASLLDAIRRVLAGAGPEVRIGVGDDAAVVAPGTGELVLTTDALVEGTHFTLDTTSARDLGAKAIAVNVSDVAAMAASPRYALCGLTLSASVDAGWVMELLGGMREGCDEYALWLVGGNIARGTEVSVSVTVVGEVAPGHALSRAGAAPGERIVVTGVLGGSALGIRLARASRGLNDDERIALMRYLRPTARVGEAGVLARHGASALIDISDGLALDLARLCAASGVGARIVADAIPVAVGAARDEALGGGEDYELLATLPGLEAVATARAELQETFGTGLSDIGEVVADGIVLVNDDGSGTPLEARGWDHFRR